MVIIDLLLNIKFKDDFFYIYNFFIKQVIKVLNK